MNRADLNMFRDLLNERKRDLIVEASRTVDGMEDSRDEISDPTDRASLEGTRTLTLRIRDRERKLITKIDEALGRIDDGSYGVCEECGGPIAVERLKARPVTTLCITCKAEQEEAEKRRG
ncbi:MAG TPA: RNA polymerase-binding protein DksA [Candidatus Limnocylindria bacterium]|nr:RNA polymerase-binding protein DksA [Candidatus Limnocylindria bacterium]